MNKILKDNLCNIIIKLNSEKHFKIYGYENKSITIDKSMTILDEVNIQKKIILKDIVVNGVLNINLIQGNLYLVNVKADRINIISKCETSIEMDYKSDVKEIYIWNKQNMHIKFNSTNINLENIYVMPINQKSKNTRISFEGEAQNCKVTILSGTSIYCSKSFKNEFIKVDIKEDNKELRLLGDFFNTKLNILNCKCIIGDENIIPENLLINLISNSNDIILKGNLANADIIVKSTMSLIVRCLYLNRLFIEEKIKVGLYFFQNTIIKSFETEGYVVIDGTLETVRNAIKQIFIIRNTGMLELNYNNKELRELKPLMECINRILLYFIKEIDHDITINELMEICGNSDINIYISDLQKEVSESNVFNLNLKEQNIKYTALEPDADRIYMQEAVMTIALWCKEKNYIYKCVPIKGKYLYMNIDYEDSSLYMQNYYSVLKYAFAQNYLNKIVLVENISVDNFNLYIENKNLNIDLNGKTFLLNNINILDSCVKIKNGIIVPTDKINKWNSLDGNISSRCFVRIEGKSIDTKFYCENLTIPNINMDFSYLPEGSTNTILFYIGDNSGHSKVKKIYFKGCSLEIKKQSIGNRDNGEPYILDTFADNNILYYNHFNESYKCIKVNGCSKRHYVNLQMLSNNFSNVTEINNSVLTLVPYRNSLGIVVNDVEFKPNLKETDIEENMERLLELSSMTLNAFGQGSCADFWQNEEGKLIKIAIYINGQWQIKDIPKVIPDSENNDMEHVICMSFKANIVWSANITEIRIINTEDRILQSYQYSVDEDLGKIYIYNVILNDEKLPIYQGLLEPGSNKIIIKSKYFNDIEINQIIKPIQIVEVVNGIGKAITRIENIGSNIISVKLILNTGGLNIGNPVEINIEP